MGDEFDSAPEPGAGPRNDSTPEPDTQRPVDEVARLRAAERQRKHRAVKKLKDAKGEAQLRKAAEEIAAPPEPKAPAWPKGEEITAAMQEVGGFVEQAAPMLAEFGVVLTEKQLKALIATQAPYYAKAKKNPNETAIARIVTPELVALAGLLFVFGPPIFNQVKSMIDGAPPPKAPDAPPTEEPKA